VDNGTIRAEAILNSIYYIHYTHRNSCLGSLVNTSWISQLSFQPPWDERHDICSPAPELSAHSGADFFISEKEVEEKLAFIQAAF